MKPKFEFNEIVRVVVQPPRIRANLLHKEGIVGGMSEPYPNNQRDYGVHINEYGETFAIPEHALVSTGRFGSHQDIVSRSKAKGREKKSEEIKGDASIS